MVDLAKLKVCFLAGCLGQGGAERQLFYILQSLRGLGTKPYLLTLTKGEYWEERIRQLDVPVTWVGRRASRLCRLGRIVSVLRKQRPEILQSQHFFANLYVVGAARVLGVREIGAIRNNATSEVNANGPVMGRLSLCAPRILAANSLRGARNAADLGVPVSRLKYLPNIVDTDAFQPLLGPKTNHDCVRLLCVGSLWKSKRVDVFLETVARLRENSKVAIKATIVGDGPLHASLKRQAVELGLLSDVAEFRGAVSDMAAVYQAADILVLTSDWEGTPNVLLEAMACGLPVVATKVGGVPEVVQDGVAGYLVKPGDVGMLVDRVARLCHEPSLRFAFGQSGRQYVVANHAPSRLPQFLQELYAAVLS